MDDEEALYEEALGAAKGRRSQPREDLDIVVETGGWKVSDIPKRPWIAKRYLLRGAVTLLIGPPSAMKSSLVLAWAVAVGLGREFGDLVPTGAERVIVYNVEDDMDEQRRRLSGLLPEFNIEPEILENRVWRVAPRTVGTLFELDPNTKLIRPSTAMEKLTQLISQIKPGVLIVDPLAELHNAEENDNTAMRSVIARFREIAATHNVAVVVLHHTSKAMSGAAGDPNSARGASALIGAVRIAMTLTSMTDKDAKDLGLAEGKATTSRFVRLDSAKANYSALSEAVWFEKVPCELENGDVVVAARPWAPAKAAVTTAQLDAVVADIKKGFREKQGDIFTAPEPWSPKSGPWARSVKQLLSTHEITTADAQKMAMERLEHSYGMTSQKYRNKEGHATGGLRIAGLPGAVWLNEDGTEESPI